MARRTTSPRTAGIPARSKSPSSPSAPSAPSAVKKSSAAKSAQIREDLESVLLCHLTPAERDHVALGIDKNFPLTISFSDNGVAVYLWQDGRMRSVLDARDHNCDQLWAECERLCPQNAADLGGETVTITHAGRIALAAQDIVDRLFGDDDRLCAEKAGKVRAQGWGKMPVIDLITNTLRKRLPDPSPSVSSVQSVSNDFGFPQVQPGTTAARIIAKCAELAQFLLGKNKSYGDSALNPIRVFSRATAREGLCTRADDKLARLQNAPGAYSDNDVKDLAGYLVFLLIQDDLDAEAKKGGTPQ